MATLVWLFLAATAIAAGPAVVAEGYDPVVQSVSECAAQGTPGSWVARTGLLFLGVAAITARPCVTRQFSAWTARAVVLFGAGLVGSAVWSHAAWLPGVATDSTEDALHTVASAVTGAGFTAALLAAIVSGWPRPRWGSLVALPPVLVVPPLMQTYPQFAGALQRVMFAVAIVWLGAAAIRGGSRRGRAERVTRIELA